MRLPWAYQIPLTIFLAIPGGFCIDASRPAWTNPEGDSTPIKLTPPPGYHQFCGNMIHQGGVQTFEFSIYRGQCTLVPSTPCPPMGNVLLCKS
ncbi:Ecp24-1 [Fulvia fulva]|uniref:Ecp24-1 n=1 Tax=Passalora fulva TaxID=5499 RepID=A0A9Q8LDQ0_PASFU|nr:Ecp24-1 [Fulvia fulva]KAK4629065.1 Ecp24-1 [Fulvia fulva]UJO15490.1 Ecp24-1 [Fulvia fulva]WPV12154.1 Ecp24-1 [Fulvia fulva]WPV27446.1 Ecp24-1 [Fulvia fulva]